ncbi:MAG: polyhydroxyalkanoate depolymerase [Pseudomonadota bacterium]
MLYSIYEMQQLALAPVRAMADTTLTVLGHPLVPLAHTHIGRAMAAGAEVLHGVIQNRSKPDWDLHSTEFDGAEHAVLEQVVRDDAFCQLRRFHRVGRDDDSKILLVAPMSGHFGTLLRGTVARLMVEHDVYVTDWRDAAQVPAEAGDFGVDDYVDHLLDYMRLLGPDLHVVAVCQPAPLVLSAVAILAAMEDPAQPMSMTLMGGPVDVTAEPTLVTRFAENRSLAWFRHNLLADVPQQYPGRGRKVYPGFMQLAAFLLMNPGRHVGAHFQQFRHLIKGDGDSAEGHRRFYDEYLSVADVTADFYLETVDCIFKRHCLPEGTMTWRGHKVDPAAIRATALMTVEGELDDISAPGQTLAAQTLCSSVPDHLRVQHMEPNVGHYGIFNGRRWRDSIAPKITEFIRRAESARA